MHDIDAVKWKVPLVQLMLLIRQQQYEDDPDCITLDD